MNKLLSANFARLFRDKIFWICMILMAIISGYVYMSAVSDMRTWNVIISPEDNLFGFSTFTAIFQSVFISIFVGTEYNDGTMRNKLAIGHSRAAIYLSNMIVCAAAGLLMCLVYMAVALAIGLLAIGGFEAAPPDTGCFYGRRFFNEHSLFRHFYFCCHADTKPLPLRCHKYCRDIRLSHAFCLYHQRPVRAGDCKCLYLCCRRGWGRERRND